MGSEHFKWSRASTFSYNRIAIGLAVAYASAIRTHLSPVVHGTAHHMSATSVRPRSANDCLIERLTSLILVNRETLVQARLLPAILSVVTCSMAIVQMQSEGWQSFAVPWQGGLLAVFPALLSLLLSLCHQVAVSTCRHKAKHRIVTSLRVPRLAVPHLDLMLTTRRLMLLMHARMSSLQTGMPMYVRALR